MIQGNRNNRQSQSQLKIISTNRNTDRVYTRKIPVGPESISNG